MEFKKPTIVYSITNHEFFLIESEFIWKDDADGLWIVKLEGKGEDTILNMNQFVMFARIYDLLFIGTL